MIPHLRVFLIFLLFTACGEKKALNGPDSKSTEDSIHITVEWPNQHTQIEIPLHYYGDIPALHCHLNNEPAIIYLDTAANGICIYQDRLERFNLNILGEGKSKLFTAGGEIQARYSEKFTLKLDDSITLNASNAFVITGRNKKYNVDGVLGISVMKALKAKINLEKDTIIFQQQDRSSSAKVSDATYSNQSMEESQQ